MFQNTSYLQCVFTARVNILVFNVLVKKQIERLKFKAPRFAAFLRQSYHDKQQNRARRENHDADEVAKEDQAGGVWLRYFHAWTLP